MSQPIELPGRRRATIRPTAKNGSVMIPIPLSPVHEGMSCDSTRLTTTRPLNNARIASATGEILLTV
jgi:hypothetical protein